MTNQLTKTPYRLEVYDTQGKIALTCCYQSFAQTCEAKKVISEQASSDWAEIRVYRIDGKALGGDDE